MISPYNRSAVTPHLLSPRVSRDTCSHYIRTGCAGRAPAKISRNIHTVTHGVKNGNFQQTKS